MDGTVLGRLACVFVAVGIGFEVAEQAAVGGGSAVWVWVVVMVRVVGVGIIGVVRDVVMRVAG